MAKSKSEGSDAVRILNRILEMELAGVVRYAHYSFMVWCADPDRVLAAGRGDEVDGHAQKAGEIITSSASTVARDRTAARDAQAPDRRDPPGVARPQSATLALYRAAEDRRGQVRDARGYARELIYEEELDAGAVDKMLRAPGDVAAFAGA
jgi:bacterioferritin